MGSGPFSFRQGTKLLAKNSPAFDFSKASFLWSPDSKEIIAKFTDSSGTVTANLLVDSEKSGQEPKDITASLLSTISNWQQQIDFQTQNLSVLAPDSVKDATAEAKVVVGSPLTVNSKSQLAKDTVNREPSTNNLLNYHPTGLMFSPDENKILYMHKDGKYRVYDIGEKKEFTLPEFSDFINISWYPDSNHLVVAQKDIISVIETDGTNKMTIYSGKFENGFVFAHPSGERLIILTTLTQPEGTPTNLYSINLK
jgi:WD40 repeat protein